MFSLSVDSDYDLPYAIAYAKLCWFLWKPLDRNHRTWMKISNKIIVSQEEPGSKVFVKNSGSHNHDLLHKELGLWFDPKDILPHQPAIVRWLYSRYPLRMSRAAPEDFPTLFAAAVLSPQVSWKVNTIWVRALHHYFQGELLRISECEPDHIKSIVKSYSPNVRDMGYHAKVLVKAIRSLIKTCWNIYGFSETEASEARKSLLGIYGVGPKIATFITQATHGDEYSICIDRHALHNGRILGLLPDSARTYFPNQCKKFIDDCKKCPRRKECAAGILSYYPTPGWISSLLYCYSINN